ncbi:MAG: hypothetical protein M1503_02535 [Thaumarchaeota archaeon]|nr:hypothetical protein [Nitrososphaerota archaeon]MCL5317128.1 hypothetical protein [Nitrososphaerota archaeon]
MKSKSLAVVGVILVVISMFWSVLNYVFHHPTYRPEWFDMDTMLRLIELNMVFTLAGIIVIIYAIYRSD